MASGRVTAIRSSFKNLPKTYPRSLGADRSLIRHDDVFQDYGHLKFIRARLEHLPIVKRSMVDFFQNEILTIAGGVITIPDETLTNLTYCLLRYPVSFFAINQLDEVVSLALSQVVYADSSKDPIPPRPVNVPAGHPMETTLKIIAAGEAEHFLRLRVDRYLHQEIAFTPTVLRGLKISSTIMPAYLRGCVEAAEKLGIKHQVALATTHANKHNLLKTGVYRVVGQLPKEIYRKNDGSMMDLQDEKPATLLELDMNALEKSGFLKMK